jgi:hypothetical protein
MAYSPAFRDPPAPVARATSWKIAADLRTPASFRAAATPATPEPRGIWTRVSDPDRAWGPGPKAKRRLNATSAMASPATAAEIRRRRVAHDLRLTGPS